VINLSILDIIIMIGIFGISSLALFVSSKQWGTPQNKNEKV
jgi:hypothetical protein